MSFIIIKCHRYEHNKSSNSFIDQLVENDSKFVYYLEFDVFDYDKLIQYLKKFCKGEIIPSITLEINTNNKQHDVLLTKDALLFASIKKIETLCFTIYYGLPKLRENKATSLFFSIE